MKKSYDTLINDVVQLHEDGKAESRRSGNHAQTRAYWDIGRRIHKYELGENGRATYGEGLIEKLSEDLTKKYGAGFSKRSLNYMIMLSREYPREKLKTGLSWSKYTLLMSVNESALRRKLEQETIKEEGIRYSV